MGDAGGWGTKYEERSDTPAPANPEPDFLSKIRIWIQGVVLPNPRHLAQDLLSDNFPPCNSLEQGFFRSLPQLAAHAKLLEIVTAKSELVKNSSYGWAQAKKEALWASWLIWALRTDSINTGFILTVQC